MLLTVEQAYALLEKHGIYAREACDACRAILGPIRYTRRGEPGVWCSRECRGDAQQPALKPGRPRKYRTQRERREAKTSQQRNYRHSNSVEKTLCSLTETKDLQTQKPPLSHTPLTPAFEGLSGA